MNKPKIVKVPYGLASSYGDVIEINSKLDDYPKLKAKILRHELAHTPGGKYTIADYKNDFNSEKPYFYQSLKLALKNPEMLVGFFPFMWSYYFNILTFNAGALIIFAVWGLIFALLCTLIFKVAFLLAFLMWICIYVTLNLILLVYTHLYQKSLNLKD